MDEYVEYCTDNLSNIYSLNPKDAQVADAILLIFSQRDKIDFFNKKALYIYA